jgi:hypothetical protein
MPFSPPSSLSSTRASRGPPADPRGAWRPAPRDLAAGLSCRYTRRVAHDNTVRLGPRWVQLPRGRSYAGRRVELRECLDGRLLVFADGACLATQPSPPAPPARISQDTVGAGWPLTRPPDPPRLSAKAPPTLAGSLPHEVP